MNIRAPMISLIVLFSLFSSVSLFAQADVPPPQALPDIPTFFIDALSFSSDQPGMSRMDVYIEVPYDALHFTKSDELFRAAYEVTLTISDSAEKQLDEKWWEEKVETKEYAESVSKTDSKLTQKSFLLAPGRYGVTVLVKDKESDKTSRQQRKVQVRNFSTAPFSVSDIMLVNKVGSEADHKVIYPNISGNVGELKNGFYIFFEAYNAIAADSAAIFLDIRNIKDNIVQSDSFVEALGTPKKSCFHLEKTDKLIAGDYFLDLRVVPLAAKNAKEAYAAASVSRPFAIRWHGLPVSLVDLDQAIDELQYIAEKDKIDDLKKAPPAEKKKMFEDFWKQRDPTPNTERNELMEEYYSRVAYANKHFTHYIDGWKTDMGMVYIIFGVPSNIERHPFDIDAKPYEIWTYYEQNREFVFVDATGFGDYHLQNPIWDTYRTRPR